MKKAFEMLVTGQFISAADAADSGLINRVVAPDELDAQVDAMVQTICSKSPLAVRVGKGMVQRQHGMNLADAYDYAGKTMAQNMSAAHVAAGNDTFTQKAQDAWQGS